MLFHGNLRGRSLTVPFSRLVSGRMPRARRELVSLPLYHTPLLKLKCLKRMVEAFILPSSHQPPNPGDEHSDSSRSVDLVQSDRNSKLTFTNQILIIRIIITIQYNTIKKFISYTIQQNNVCMYDCIMYVVDVAGDLYTIAHGMFL